MTNSSKTLFRGIAALLAGLGLLPFFWAGIVSGDWSVARVTLIDPLVIAALCVAIVTFTSVRPRPDLVLRVRAPILMGLVAIFIIAMSVHGARVGYNGQPALTDELTQAFQGKILMSGRLAAAPEDHPEFFETAQTLTVGGRWFTEYPIGSGVIAAIGSWTGLAILINPLLLVLAAFALWSFTRRAFDETTARFALILMALSPFAFLMAGTRMNHVPTLTLAAVALASLAKWDQQSRRSGAAIGAALGAMVLFRPYDAVLVAIPIAAFQLATVFRRRDLLPSLGVQIAVGAAITGIQLWVNARTTGSPWVFGYDALNGPAHGPGFHPDPLGFAFTPSDGIDQVMLYLQRLNTSLFESAVPALVFIVIGMWLSRPTKWDWLLAGVIVSFLAGYGAYWHEGMLNGPRFLYPALIAFVVFAARFVVLAAERQRPVAQGAALMVPVCIALAFIPSGIGNRSTGVWLRLAMTSALPVSRSENPAAEAKAAGLKNALVFVREPFHARLAARLHALGMRPFDAERAAADLDACALMTALDRSTSLETVLAEARAAGKATPVPGLRGFNALALIGGRASSPTCHREMAEDSLGTLYYARFLAAATIDSTGRLGGDVIYARTLGARDSVLLLNERFASREWYMYRREDARNTGRFERIR